MMNENQIYRQMYELLRMMATEVTKAYDDESNPGRLAIAVEHLKNQIDAYSKPTEAVKSDDLRTNPGSWLEIRTTDELEAIQKEWYKRAKTEGIIGNCYLIGRELGSDPAGPGYTSNYGPKRQWESDNLRIYVDDYGHYMTVSYHQKVVCSTHGPDVFIPGEWVSIIDRVVPAASDRRNRREIEKAENNRRRLIDSMSL